jgi:peptidyl-prolyl cis-trans isomerase SurA
MLCGNLRADVMILEEIVCKVNNEIITRNELEKDRKEMETQMRQRSGLTGRALADAINDTGKELLAMRVDKLLLVQKAKELDLKVDPELQKRLADLQRRSGIADPNAFQEWVHEGTGMPFEDYKADLKNNFMIERLRRQEVGSTLKVKREELEKYYNDHKDDFQRKEEIYLRVIFVSTENKDSQGVAAADRKARDVSRRAKAGEKFVELAQANSDAATAANGGEMPGFEKKELRPDVVAAVWDQPKGFVTDPIKTAYGYEVYRVEEHQKAGLAEFEEVQAMVEDRVLSPRMDVAMRDYLTKLRKDAFLEIKPGWTDAYAAPGKNTTWQDAAQLTPATTTKEEVAAEKHKKKLLGLIPVPGTTSKNAGTSSSH